MKSSRAKAKYSRVTPATCGLFAGCAIVYFEIGEPGSRLQIHRSRFCIGRILHVDYTTRFIHFCGLETNEETNHKVFCRKKISFDAVIPNDHSYPTMFPIDEEKAKSFAISMQNEIEFDHTVDTNSSMSNEERRKKQQALELSIATKLVAVFTFISDPHFTPTFVRDLSIQNACTSPIDSHNPQDG